MKKIINYKTISKKIICIMLIAAMAFTFVACGTKSADNSGTTGTSSVEQATVSFKLVVVDGNGKEASQTIETTEKTVGAALLKEGIISGEEGQYGLYVDTVNGIKADYDKDGTYWAFYIGSEYANTGVDSTDIEANQTYSLKLQK